MCGFWMTYFIWNIDAVDVDAADVASRHAISSIDAHSFLFISMAIHVSS